MTYWKWSQLYKSYKRNFDNELTLKLNRQRYCDLEKAITLDDAIPF